MAHIGQKLALGPGSSFGGLFSLLFPKIRILKPLFRFHLGSQITKDLKSSQNFSRRILQESGAGHRRDLTAFSIFYGYPLAHRGFISLQSPFYRTLFFAGRTMENLATRHSNCLFTGQACQAHCSLIDECHIHLRIDRKEGIGNSELEAVGIFHPVPYTLYHLVEIVRQCSDRILMIIDNFYSDISGSYLAGFFPKQSNTPRNQTGKEKIDEDYQSYESSHEIDNKSVSCLMDCGEHIPNMLFDDHCAEDLSAGSMAVVAG